MPSYTFTLATIDIQSVNFSSASNGKCYLGTFHRVDAAALAISDRRSGVSLAPRAFPALLARRLSATGLGLGGDS